VPRNAVWVLILGFTAFVATGPALHGAAAPPPAAATAPTRAFLDDYCTSCHNDRLKTGGLSLDPSIPRTSPPTPRPGKRSFASCGCA